MKQCYRYYFHLSLILYCAYCISSQHLHVNDGPFSIFKFNYIENYILDVSKVNVNKSLHFCYFPKDHVLFDLVWNIPKFPLLNYVEIGSNNDYLTNKPGTYKSCAFTLDFHLMCVKNIIFCSNNVYIPPESNVVYYMDWLSNAKSGTYEIRKVVDGKFVAAGNSHSNFFGDLMYGSLSRLLQFPKEILDGCTMCFSYTNFKKYIDEVLEAAGIKNYKIIWLWYTEPIFVRELYLFQPYFNSSFQPTECLHSFYGYIYNNLGEVIRNKYQTYKIQPTAYALVFRERGMKRFIENHVECEEAIRRKYPDVNFTRYPHSYPSLKESALSMATIKWMFGPPGSNMMHCIFMHRGMTVCTFLCSWFDYPVTTTFATRGIHGILFTNSSWIDISRKPILIPIDRLLKYVKRSFDVMKNNGFEGLPGEKRIDECI